MKIHIWMTNKHVKRCSTSLVTREIQIKITVGDHHFVPSGIARISKWETANVGGRCRQRETSETTSENVKWLCYHGKFFWFQYDLAILPLDKYPKHRKLVFKYISRCMFIAALFRRDSRWKQPRCASTIK